MIAFALLPLLALAEGEYTVWADFTGETPPRRAIRDVDFNCDLSRAAGVSFECKIENLAEFSSFNFYFGFANDVWCSTDLYPTVEGEWAKITVRRPADEAGRYDWSKVTGFRFSAWRGGARNTKIYLRDFAVVETLPVPTAEEAAAAEAARIAANADGLAHLAASVPVRNERRFVWAHNPNGMTGRSWDEAARLVASGGFTDLIVNLARGPMSAYPSDVLVHSTMVGGIDRLAECLAACHRHGLKLHAWNVCWGMGWKMPEEMRRTYEADGRLQVSDAGTAGSWLCPNHPDNRAQLIAAMVELAGKGVDGVHFDYIRYPDSQYCFCDRCRAAFERLAGGPIENWPGAVTRDTRLKKLWRQFRCDSITAPVRAVSEAVRSGCPDVEVSAAVYRDPLADPDLVGQDWAAWCEAGYLDFVCPMTYEDDLGWFRRKLNKQAEQVGGSVPRYPGIGLGVWTRDGLDVARFAEQVAYVRASGLGGFSVFSLDWKFEQLLPKVQEAMLPKVRSANAFVFLRPEESSFWHTATNSTMELPTCHSVGAEPVSLTVQGTRFKRTYGNLTNETVTVELPPVRCAADEHVYSLTLTMADGTSCRTSLGLVCGCGETEATTSLRLPMEEWDTIRKRVVIPIPYGMRTLRVNGKDVDPGLDGAQGWYEFEGANDGFSVFLK